MTELKDRVNAVIDNAKILTHKYLQSSVGYDMFTSYVASLVFYKFAKRAFQEKFGHDTEVDLLMADIDQCIEDHSNQFFEKK